MAAVPLFRDTNMAAVTSRENTLYALLRKEEDMVTLKSWIIEETSIIHG